MATIVTDDITGEKGARAYTLVLDGRTVTLDLTDNNIHRVREAMALVETVKRVANAVPAPSTTAPPRDPRLSYGEFRQKLRTEFDAMTGSVSHRIATLSKDHGLSYRETRSRLVSAPRITSGSYSERNVRIYADSFHNSELDLSVMYGLSQGNINQIIQKARKGIFGSCLPIRTY